jgi:putative heme iron utilization protein
MTVTRFELEAAQLVMSHRWAALATIGEDGPNASMVAYASTRDVSNLLLFSSDLAQHTRNMVSDPRVALIISEPDSTGTDPQTLARVSINGHTEQIERGAPEFSDLWQVYGGRLPDAARLLALGDFSLFRVVVVQARYVGGFGRAHTIPVSRLSEAALAF